MRGPTDRNTDWTAEVYGVAQARQERRFAGESDLGFTIYSINNIACVSTPLKFAYPLGPLAVTDEIVRGGLIRSKPDAP